MAKHPPASVNLLVRSWRRTPQFIKWIGYVGSISGTIYALSQVLPIIEPGFPRPPRLRQVGGARRGPPVAQARRREAARQKRRPPQAAPQERQGLRTRA